MRRKTNETKKNFKNICIIVIIVGILIFFGIMNSKEPQKLNINTENKTVNENKIDINLLNENGLNVAQINENPQVKIDENYHFDFKTNFEIVESQDKNDVNDSANNVINSENIVAENNQVEEENVEKAQSVEIVSTKPCRLLADNSNINIKITEYTNEEVEKMEKDKNRRYTDLKYDNYNIKTSAYYEEGTDDLVYDGFLLNIDDKWYSIIYEEGWKYSVKENITNFIEYVFDTLIVTN